MNSKASSMAKAWMEDINLSSKLGLLLVNWRQNGVS